MWRFLELVRGAVILRVLSVPPLNGCPSACLCLPHGEVNCSSSALLWSPESLPVDTSRLDLSNNSLSHISVPLLPRLSELTLGNNRVSRMSLCASQPGPSCGSWAPALRLLEVEKNQLRSIPEGLGGSPLLQVLILSFNRISSLQYEDLEGCVRLRVLHLHHNHISTIYHRAFQHLQALQVLDVSFNNLRMLPAPAYLCLQKLHTRLQLHGNPWRCDCNLQALMTLGEEQLMCAEPPHISSRDLCEPSSYLKVTVVSGTDVLLPCGIADQTTCWTAAEMSKGAKLWTDRSRKSSQFSNASKQAPGSASRMSASSLSSKQREDTRSTLKGRRAFVP